MKNICLILFLLFYSLIYSQNTEGQRISLVSPNRDTLWLLNDNTGHLIAYSWKDYNDTTEQKKPVILLVNSLPLNKYCLLNKKRNRKLRKK